MFVYYRYKTIVKQVLGVDPLHKDKKKPVRYFQRRARGNLMEDAIVCTPIPHLESDESIEKSYIPSTLSYAETLRVSEGTESKQDSSFYLNTVDVSAETKTRNSTDTEYDYWMRQSMIYNQRLTKEATNEHLWLDFIRFQDRAFVHLFRGSAITMSASGAEGTLAKGKSTRALAERKLSLLEAGIKKCPHSLSLQLERLSVGEEVWELEQRNKEWAALVYNFPGNMHVWHRSVQARGRKVGPFHILY